MSFFDLFLTDDNDVNVLNEIKECIKFFKLHIIPIYEKLKPYQEQINEKLVKLCESEIHKYNALHPENLINETKEFVFNVFEKLDKIISLLEDIKQNTSQE